MTQAEIIRDKIVRMIREKAGYGIDLLKTCDDYDITISDFYDFLFDMGYESKLPLTVAQKSNVKVPKVETKEVVVKEPVNHPDYYTTGGLEAIDVIHSWNLGFDLGNAVKYISRAGKKNPDKYLEDLEKARWYISSEIERYKKENGKT